MATKIVGVFTIVVFAAFMQQCVFGADDPNGLFKQAMTFEAKGDLSQAQAIYSQILSQYPASSAAKISRAGFRVKLMQCKIALQNDDIAGARSSVDQIKAMGGTASQAASRLYNTAEAFEAAKLYDDAISLYQQTITQNSQDKYAGDDYAGFKILLTQCKRSLREYDTASARQFVEQIKKLKPSADKAASQLYAAANEFAQAQYYDKMLSNDAIGLYQQLISQYPNSVYAGTDYAGWRLKLAQCKLALKTDDIASARTYANQIKALSGSASQKAEYLYNIGFGFDEVHALDDATGFYRQAIAQCPTNPAVVSKNTFQLKCIEKEIAIASPNVDANDVAGIMAEFVGSFENGGSMSAATHGIGKYIYETGVSDKSPNGSSLVQKAAAIYGYWDSHHNPNDKWLTNLRQGWMCYYYGLCLNRTGDFAKAAIEFQNAYQSNPKHQYADYLLFAQGYCYKKLFEQQLVPEIDAKAIIKSKYSELILKFPQSVYKPYAQSQLEQF